MKKIGLSISLQSDFSAFKGDLYMLMNELAKVDNSDISINLKADPKDIKKSFEQVANMAEEVADNIKAMLKNATDPKDISRLQAEYNQFTSIARSANTEVKKLTHSIEMSFEQMHSKTTRSRLGIALDLENLGKSLKDIKKQSLSGNNIIDVNSWQNNITQVQNQVQAVEAYMQKHWQTMTDQQKAHANKQLENHRK